MHALKKAPVIQNRARMISYLRLGRLLHLMACAEILIIVFLFYYFDLLAWANAGNQWPKSIVLSCLLFPPLYPILDARSRYQNYKQVKDKLYEFGFQERLIRPFSCSRCQRDAVLAAAEELGYGADCHLFFKSQGYRYYHVFPDFLWSNPAYVFSKQFWLNTFFVKHYSSKYDYRVLEQLGLSD